MSSLRRAGLSVAATFAAIICFSSVAEATEIQVTNLNNSGSGSLRGAIGLAELAGNRDTIVFQPGLHGTINLSGDLPSLTSPLDIEGPGADRITVRYSGTPYEMFGFQNNLGTEHISGLTISNSYGIHADPGTSVVLKRVAITDGVRAVEVANGDAEITESTISGNASNTSVIYLAHGDLTIANSTIANNTTSSASRSAGVEVKTQGIGLIENSTIANNSAPAGTGADSLLATDAGLIDVDSSIVDGTTGGAPSCEDNSNGAISSDGFNIDDGATCGFGESTDHPSTSPLILGLADNGGPTETMSVPRLSPAIDAGVDDHHQNHDQRGLGRTEDQPGIASDPGSDGTDIGAYEHQAAKVTNLNDTGFGSLRAGIGELGNEPGADVLTFSAGLLGTITLHSALPSLSSLEIQGPGANRVTVQRAPGAPSFRIFNQSTPFGLLSTLPKISGLTILGGKTSGSGGGVLVGSGAKLELDAVNVEYNSAADGSGIATKGDLILNQSSVGFNEGTAGAGGISVSDGGSLTADSSSVYLNSSSSPTGVGNLGVSGGGSEATITNSTIAYGGADGQVSQIKNAGGAVSIGNSIVAAPQAASNCSGSITSLGHNLDDGSSCGLAGTGDIQSGTAGLADVGPEVPGPSGTVGIPILPTSDAIDAGLALGGAATDQRGLPRTVDFAGVTAAPTSDNTDIGAYERQNSDADGDGVFDGDDACDNLPGAGASGCPTVVRTLKLGYAKRLHRFRGRLKAASDACRSGVKVKVLRVKKNGSTKKFAKGKTSSSGRFKIKKHPVPHGTYRARVKAHVVPDHAECLAAVSPDRTVD